MKIPWRYNELKNKDLRMDSILSALHAEIEQTSLRDQWQLKKRLHGVPKIQDQKSRMAVIEVIKGDIEKAKQKVEKKTPEYAENCLP